MVGVSPTMNFDARQMLVDDAGGGVEAALEEGQHGGSGACGANAFRKR